MKPFNLEEYKKNPDRKVIRKDRSPVRIICTDCKNERPIIALYWDRYLERECVITYNINGQACDNEENPCDLFFAPEKHEGYINLYKTEAGQIYPGSHIEEDTKLLLAAKNKSHYVATIKIEWED